MALASTSGSIHLCSPSEQRRNRCPGLRAPYKKGHDPPMPSVLFPARLLGRSSGAFAFCLWFSESAVFRQNQHFVLYAKDRTSSTSKRRAKSRTFLCGRTAGRITKRPVLKTLLRPVCLLYPELFKSLENDKILCYTTNVYCILRRSLAPPAYLCAARQDKMLILSN